MGLSYKTGAIKLKNMTILNSTTSEYTPLKYSDHKHVNLQVKNIHRHVYWFDSYQ